MSAPQSHYEESVKLSADAVVDLFTITLKTLPVVIRVKNDNTVTWQGQTYEGWPVQLEGDKRHGDGEEARPSFIFTNPLGAFNKYAAEGAFDKATFIRRRVLRTALEDDINVFEQHMWYVSRVREIKSGQAITLELRSLTEGPIFRVPARQYLPPEFPVVNLS